MTETTAASKLREVLDGLRELSGEVQSDEEARELSSKIAQVSRRLRIEKGMGIAPSPLVQAQEIDPSYVVRPHLAYLSSRLVNAVRDMERGKNRQLIVSMPPRSGKSTMTSQYFPLWLMRRHPEWEYVMVSYSESLAMGWAKNLRYMIEDKPDLGVALKKDAGAQGRWDTVEGGSMFVTGTGGPLTGRGARVLIIDDPIADFTAAHSLRIRESLWNWWLSVAQTRLEAPYLVLVTMTRWHEDDFAGRLLSEEYEGDPREWENIRLPAVAEHDDALGRPLDAPLLSPIIKESVTEASERWERTKVGVGSYTFASMYQQRPAPQKGAIFDVGWWKYWTKDATKATDDGRIVYLDPGELGGSRWLDSWDCAFKGGESSSSYVVGQRWVRHKANRYLIAQQRGRWSFTETIKKMKQWARNDDHFVSPYGEMVHERVIEDKANGAAILDTLREEISGMKPVSPGNSKEARARAVTPEIESGNVFLPHPTDPGNEWVTELLSELRNFPHDMYDDQVDSMTQALSALRTAGSGSVTVPGRGRRFERNVTRTGQSALTQRRIPGRR